MPRRAHTLWLDRLRSLCRRRRRGRPREPNMRPRRPDMRPHCYADRMRCLIAQQCQDHSHARSNTMAQHLPQRARRDLQLGSATTRRSASTATHLQPA
eukprot:5534620-Pyramimonas_sp.AAC.1